MSEKERNLNIFNLWSMVVHIMNVAFTIFNILISSRFLGTSDLFTPLFFILITRFFVIMVVWIDIGISYDFSTKPRKISTLEKAQRVINKGEYKKQLKEDKEELRRRKGISRELKYIERAIILQAKMGFRETSYNLPVDYCVKDVELYLQNHGFEAEIDYNEHTHNCNLDYCHPLHIKW